MHFDLIQATAKNILWIILSAWVILRYLLYSEKRFPKPPWCSSKDYKKWRNLESLPVQLTVFGTALSIIFTALLRTDLPNDHMLHGFLRSVFWLAGLVLILIIQSVAKNRWKLILKEPNQSSSNSNDSYSENSPAVSLQLEKAFMEISCPHCGLMMDIDMPIEVTTITCPACNDPFEVSP